MTLPSTSNLCPVCRGAGSIVTFSRGIEYWPCVCGGSGVRVQHGPATVVTHGRPAKRRKARMPDAGVRMADAGEIARLRCSLTENNARARNVAQERYALNPRAADLR